MEGIKLLSKTIIVSCLFLMGCGDDEPETPLTSEEIRELSLGNGSAQITVTGGTLGSQTFPGFEVVTASEESGTYGLSAASVNNLTSIGFLVVSFNDLPEASGTYQLDELGGSITYQFNIGEEVFLTGLPITSGVELQIQYLSNGIRVDFDIQDTGGFTTGHTSSSGFIQATQ